MPTDSAPRTKFHYSFQKILTGSDLSRRRLPLMLAEAEAPGPTVWLTGAAHGDEVGGVVVIHEVFRRLRRRPLLRGSVHAFPLMNPIGFETGARNITLSGEDLNRAFPGDVGGSVAERLATLIYQRIRETEPALVLDLHNDWLDSIPYCVIDPLPGAALRAIHRRTREIARVTGFLVVDEDRGDPDSKGWESTLSGSLLSAGVPALTLELGSAKVVNERNVDYGVRSIWNALDHLGMVEPDPERFVHPVADQLRDRILRYSCRPFSSSSGIIRFLVRPGQTVAPGQPFARIYNAFGKIQQTLRASEQAVVIGTTDFSVAFPGVAIIAFAKG